MELNLILFVIFLLVSPFYVFLIGKNELVNSNTFLNIFVFFYIILAGYLLFFVSGITFLVLVVVIGVWFIVYKKIFQKWTINKENFSIKKFFIVSGKIFAILFGVYITFVVVATALGLYMSYYEAPIRDIDPNVLVEACRANSQSCYALRAHFIDEYCESEYTTRGQTGSCVNSYIEKIYFDDGGYRAFHRNDCGEIGSDKWLCTDNDGDDWNIEITGRIKNE